MISPRVLLFSFCCFLFSCCCRAQEIVNADGSFLTTEYCREDKDYGIAGQPAGGIFSGCGVFEQNGQWYFNPATATVGITAYPHLCSFSYAVNDTVVNVPVLIWKPVTLSLIADSGTCDGDFSLLAQTLYAGDYDFSWTPAPVLTDPDSPFTKGHIQQTKTFVCIVTDQSNGCKGKDTVTVLKLPLPQLRVSNDTMLLQHTSAQLFATGAATYKWVPAQWLDNPEAATPVTSPADSVTYIVTGTNEYGCSASAQVHIRLAEGIYFPNAFSPNGDGLNDEFRIANFGYQDLKEFRIFNRWGQQVFFTMNGTKGWDGTFNNKPSEAGTYHYLIRLKLKDGIENTLKGDLTLIR
jgi:gliding motility-associated-like protein